MKTRFLSLCLLAPLALAQSVDIKGFVHGNYQLPVIAVPGMRGSGAAQAQMNALNAALFAGLQDSGVFKMAAKSFYPLEVPQRPEDFRTPLNNQRMGPWLTDWSKDPVNAIYMTLGYAAEQNGRLVLFGWLMNVTQPDVNGAKLFNRLYFGDLSETGARKVAHEFAADILKHFGITPMIGTRIYYTNVRGNVKEIWMMDWDGSNKKQLTRLNSTTSYQAVSADGTRMAYTTFAGGQPSIRMMSLETGRQLTFFSQQASLNTTPDFTPDGKLLFASSAHGGYANIYMCNLDGSGLRRIAPSRAIEVEPKVNPKNPNEIVLTTGRSGPPQIYKMNLDGADVTRLSDGTGDAVNPAWHPDGQHIAFSWTKGYDPGNFNIFFMDVASKDYYQLTHGAGRNENPSWAPDGRHLVFASTRSGTAQIWSMLADGTQLRQLTFEGRNERPVWGK